MRKRIRRGMLRTLGFCLALLCLLTSCNSPEKDGPQTDVTETDSGSTRTDSSTTDGKDPPVSPVNGTVVNIDSDALTYLYEKNGKKFTDLRAECIAWFECHYKDCGISDLLYNLDGAVPSKTHGYRGDRYNKTEENGVSVDYKNNTGVVATYQAFEVLGIDPYEIWFDQCRKNGINPWLSFRMNDVHSADAKTGHSDFFYRAKENGWFIGNSRANYWLENPCTQGSRAWYQYCLNYRIPEVRQYFVDYIDEMLGRYDTYGIELDWQRCIWCFPEDSVDNCQYINLFMAAVNQTVAKYEKQYGHPIKIMARINRDIDENKYFGFDVEHWAKQDWIDVVVPASYWGATDGDMPISVWKERLKAYPSVEIYAGLECHTVNNRYWQSISTLAGYTANYLSQGADKIYLYNLFNDIKEKMIVCSSLERALAAAKRSYPVSRANTTPQEISGIREYAPFPMSLYVNEAVGTLQIQHGPLAKERDTVIYLGVSGIEKEDISADTMIVRFNGVECTYKGISSKSEVGNSGEMGYILSFTVPASAIQGNGSTVTVEVNMNLKLNYAELINGNARI